MDNWLKLVLMGVPLKVGVMLEGGVVEGLIAVISSITVNQMLVSGDLVIIASRSGRKCVKRYIPIRACCYMVKRLSATLLLPSKLGRL